MRSPLKWHGGKHYLAKRIVALMPAHLHYVEPYFGGGAVLFAKNPEGVSEVANDIHQELINFWQVLQGSKSANKFIRIAETIPFSQVQYELAEMHPSPQCHLDIDAAVAFFVRCRQSRAGCMKDFATVTRHRTRRDMNEQVSGWLTAVDGLPDVYRRLRRVLVFCDDALKVIKQQDGSDTLFYCDPPYLKETRIAGNVYRHEMSEFAHACLLAVLATPEAKPNFGGPWTPAQWKTLTTLYYQPLKGSFLLSGYQSKLYDDMASAQGWRRVDFDLPNNAAGGKTKRRMTECVWMNYEPKAAADAAKEE